MRRVLLFSAAAMWDNLKEGDRVCGCTGIGFKAFSTCQEFVGIPWVAQTQHALIMQ